MSALPVCQTLLLESHNGVLHITLNRPESRNAMSLQMVAELRAVLAAVRDDRSVRALVIGGAGGHFCAGGDIKDMANARAQGPDAYRDLNRAFGALLQEVQHAPQVVITVLQGAVLGGGFGLACVADVAIASDTANFRLPETSLGVVPAQIAPFLVERLGYSQAKRLAVTGGRLDAATALTLGLVHGVTTSDGLAPALDKALVEILACAPGALAATKALMRRARFEPAHALVADAATVFAQSAQSAEGVEGMTAFIQKRKPNWTPT